MWQSEPETFTSHAVLVTRAYRSLDKMRTAFKTSNNTIQRNKDVRSELEEESNSYEQLVDHENELISGIERAGNRTSRTKGESYRHRREQQRTNDEEGERSSCEGRRTAVTSEAGEKEVDSNEAKELITEYINDERLNSDLIKVLLQLVVRLEAGARRLVLDNMEDSVARTVLLADRNGRSFRYMGQANLSATARYHRSQRDDS